MDLNEDLNSVKMIFFISLKIVFSFIYKQLSKKKYLTKLFNVVGPLQISARQPKSNYPADKNPYC